MDKPLIFIGSDHRGFALKGRFILWLKERGYEVRDVGPETADRCNASDYAVKLAAGMKADSKALGVLICSTGVAMGMTANRFAHLRAASCFNSTMARLARQHNHANVLVLGANVVGEDTAIDALETFLNTDCLGGAYADRTRLLADLGGL